MSDDKPIPDDDNFDDVRAGADAPRAPLAAMLEEFIERRLDAGGIEQLENLAAETADALEFVANYLHLHSSLTLRAAYSTSNRTLGLTAGLPFSWPPSGPADKGAVPPKTSTMETPPQTAAIADRSPARSIRRARPIALAAAAVAVLLMVAVMAIIRAPGWMQRHVPPLGKGSPEIAAHLVKAVDCQWIGERTPRAGEALHAGERLELREGLAEIGFLGGARVVLEGPAKIQIQSGGLAELETGALLASVPRRARGFTVLTPTARVVDLGTEFGVLVDAESGETDLHVFEGRVRALRLAEDKNAADGESFELLAGDSVRLRREEEFSSDNRPTVEDRLSAQDRFSKLRAVAQLRQVNGGMAAANILTNVVARGDAPPRLDNTFGTTKVAYNFGGGDLTRDGIDFKGFSVSGDPVSTIVANSPFTIELSAAGPPPSVLRNDDLDGDPLFETEIYTKKGYEGTPLRLILNGLNPDVAYRIQIMHGDPRHNDPYHLYDNGTVTFTDGANNTATARLTFGGIDSKHRFALVTATVRDTTSLTYEIPHAGRGGSIAGISIQFTPVSKPSIGGEME